MADIIQNEKIALQTVIGLKFVNKSDIVLIQYVATAADSKLTWTVMLNSGDTIRLKLNNTAKDILTSLNRSNYVQINQTVILNIDYLSTIELKTRKCVLVSPFEKYEYYVSRLFLKNIRKQYELNL
ncbi:MAG: LytTR family DNA-binding domain-containing protein [Paludibacter sp.]|jgi:DNA-binding LytR/AlgR family response regulator|nr:LytTR family DNA-binding domain-containing protein [Paludibacter sp.]